MDGLSVEKPGGFFNKTAVLRGPQLGEKPLRFFTTDVRAGSVRNRRKSERRARSRTKLAPRWSLDVTARDRIREPLELPVITMSQDMPFLAKFPFRAGIVRMLN